MTALAQAGGGFAFQRLSVERLALYALALSVGVIVIYPLLCGVQFISWETLHRLTSPQTVDPLGNSILIALLTAIFAALIGVPLAWICGRSDLPGRDLIALLISVSFVLPILLTSIAYIFLFGKNGGLVNAALAGWLGGPLYNVYSFSGVVLVSVLHSYPLVFFTTLSGLSKMNPELEEAGRISGLSAGGVFFRITLGAVLPSILAGVVFVVAEALTMLAAPLMLGLPVGFRFMTTELYSSIVMNADLVTAVALGIPLITMTLVVLAAQSWLVGGSGSARFAVLSGKGSRDEAVSVRRLRKTITALAWVPVFLSLILPVATLLVVALMDKWWKGLKLSNVSLRNFEFVLHDSSTLLAVKNSIWLALGVAVAVTAFGAAFALFSAGPPTLLKRLVRQVTAAPLGIPHVVAGVLVILAWYGEPFHIGGTIWILALGYVFVMAPYGARTCEVAYGQIDGSLAEAADVAGCSPLQRWGHVTLPLMRNGLVTTFVIVFLFAIKEFSLTAMVYSAQTVTLPVRVFTFLEGGSYEKTAAASMLLLALTLGTLVIASKVFRLSISNLRV